MKILIDTHVFLWMLYADRRVSEKAKGIFQDNRNDIFLSVVSAWEISIKYALKKLPLPEPPPLFVPSRRKKYRIVALPFDEESALYVSKLTSLHKDPFDRALMAQSIVQGMPILTNDPLIAQYPVRILW